MKLIKLAIISIVVLFVVITSIGLLLPSTVRVTRNINIQTPRDTLYQYINNMNKWKLWLEGVADSTIVFKSETTIGKGTTALISGKQVSIVKTSKNEIETNWQNSRGNSQRGIFQFGYDTTSGATNLNWYFEQKVSWYPWERLSTLANDKVLGPVMEHSLDKLKVVAESAKN